MAIFSQPLSRKWFTATLSALVISCGGSFGGTATAQDAPDALDAQAVAEALDGGDAEVDVPNKVKFSFSKTPWEQVLQWIADQNELSFNMWSEPKGTLTLTDSEREYTPREALDEVNGHLLAQGYTLLRRNKTLYILDLETEIDQKLVRDLLLETPLEDLDKLGNFELSKVRFQMSAITAEAGKEQVQQLIGPQGSIITVPLARQLLITETGENLRRIRDTLETVERQLGADVKAFRLKNATADEVVTVAKRLLGIAEEENKDEGNTVFISEGTNGKTVYAKGTPDKIAVVAQVVEQVEEMAAASGKGDHHFKSHPVKRGDPQLVLRVAQTMLSSDPTVRLSAGVDNILAYASTEQHQRIDGAIAEIELAPTELAVIPLRRTDPLTAVALIERIFVKEGDESSPIIDAMFDPDQLVIRGSSAQLEQIQELLASIGERVRNASANVGPDTRVLPIDEAALPEALELLRRMWPEVGKGNRIRVVEPPRRPMIRVVPRNDDTEIPSDSATIEERDTTSLPRTRTLFVQQPTVVAQATSADTSRPQRADDIVLFMTPDGLRVVSEDSAALDALEDLFSSVGLSGRSSFNLFHLKHIEADAAETLLVSLLTTEGASEGAEGSERSGVLGLMSTGSGGGLLPTIITDTRLNRLWVKGTAGQVRQVEELLQVIDVESGPVDVETNPKPSYIPVFYQNAESIVEILQNLYADRLVQANQQSRGGRGGFGFGRGGSENQATSDETPKMTVAADPTSNLVIVSAPGPLLKEVEEVVRELDVRAEAAPTEQYVVHRLTSGASPSVIKQALKGSYGDIIQTEGDGIVVEASQSGNSRNSSNTSSQSSSDARRAAFIQMMRGGGSPFGGGRGGSSSFGRGGGDRGGSSRGGATSGGRGGGGGRGR